MKYRSIPVYRSIALQSWQICILLYSVREFVTKLVTNNFRTYIQLYTNLPTSQGYIFRILQHFATKLCSFSNFDNFFQEISFVIPRLKIFLKRKSSISKTY